MTSPSKDNAGKYSLLGLQEEMHMLRDAIHRAYDKVLGDVSFSEHLRFIATLSVALTRFAALDKFERQLTAGEDASAEIIAKIYEAAGDLEPEE